MKRKDVNKRAKTVAMASVDKLNVFATSLESKSSNKLFLYDTGASSHAVNSTTYLTEVRKLPYKHTITGVGGELCSDTVGNLPGFGSVMVYDDLPINILSASLIGDRYKVTYQHNKSFTVYVDTFTRLVFNIGTDGLYYCDLSHIMGNKVSKVSKAYFSAVGTVNNNKVGYSAKEIARADTVKETIKKLGYPSYGDLSDMINNGSIINSPITSTDVRNCVRIYGPLVETVKGKTRDIGCQPTQRVESTVTLRTNQVMHTDIMYADEVMTLITVVKPINLVIATDLQGNRSSKNVMDAVEQQIDLLRSRNFVVTNIHLDPDRSFIPLRNKLRGIQVNIAASGSHVPVVERAITVIKNACRTILAGLSYNLPKRLIKYLVLFACNRINCINRSSGVGVSAREAFRGVKLDFKRDIKLAFGTYVQLYSPPKRNNNVRINRTTAAISICPQENGTGSWYFYGLETGNILSGDNFRILPIPGEVITHLNKCHLDDSSNNKDNSKVTANSDNINNQSSLSSTLPTVSTNDTSISNNALVEPQHQVVPEIPSAEGLGILVDNGELEDDEELGGGTNCETHQTGIEHVDPDGSLQVESDTILHLSLNKGTAIYGETAKKALHAELLQLVEKNVWTPVKQGNSSQTIRSSVFFKEKFDDQGELAKLKARLVAGGDQQDQMLYPNKSSPTVATENLFSCLGIAASEKRFIASIDVEGAFLEAPMTGEPVYMYLDSQIVNILRTISPSIIPFIKKNGRLMVRLNKALYGCVQSAKLWYDKLKKILLEIGFVKNKVDFCVFNRVKNNIRSTIAFHVDDLLITSSSNNEISDIIELIRARVGGLKVQRGNKIKFLGMNFVRSNNGDIDITMSNYINECVAEWQTVNKSKCPNHADLFEEFDSVLLPEKNKKVYHSGVAKLLYLAKRARPDILTTVSHLSSRVQKPTNKDLLKLDKVFEYLHSSVSHGIHFNGGSEIQLEVYADASYGVHDNGKSRTGVIAMIAGGVIDTLSTKQSMVTKSSTEAELIALSEGTSTALRCKQFLEMQGIVIECVKVYQDNKSVITMINAGKSNSKRTKHIKIHYFFTKDYMDKGEIDVIYCPTELMIADIMTKPLMGFKFITLRDKIVKVT